MGTTNSKYATRRNEHGQTIVIVAADYDRPHVRASWYWAGCWESGTTAVREGETPESAVARAFPGANPRNLTIRPVVWSDEPRAAEVA